MKALQKFLQRRADIVVVVNYQAPDDRAMPLLLSKPISGRHTFRHLPQTA
jgi:hypothetical protein